MKELRLMILLIQRKSEGEEFQKEEALKSIANHWPTQ